MKKIKKHRKGGLRNGAGRKAGPKTVTVSFRVLESHAEVIKETVAAKIKELNEGRPQAAGKAVTITLKKENHAPEIAVGATIAGKNVTSVKKDPDGGVIITASKATLTYQKPVKPMPVKMKGENGIDFAARKNEWKKNHIPH